MAPPTVHHEKLFNGSRIAACSVKAQLYYPRLLLAANGFGRIEVDPARIIAVAFRTFFPNIPTEQEIADVLAEYSQNHLLFLYSSGGQLWGQFDIPENLLPRKKTAADQRSPEPDAKKLSAWRSDYQRIKSGKSKVVNKLRLLAFDGEPIPTNSDQVQKRSDQERPVVVVEVVGVDEEKQKVATLPDWLPVEPWEAFVEMRKKIKAPLTEYAKKQCFKQLEMLRTRGHPPELVLNQSVMKGWRGVFELSNGNHHPQLVPKPAAKSVTEVMAERERGN
jgi:hypothetical protein